MCAAVSAAMACRADLSPFARLAVVKSELSRSKRLNDNAKRANSDLHDAFANLLGLKTRTQTTIDAIGEADRKKNPRRHASEKTTPRRGGGAAYSHGRPSRGRDDHE